MRITGVNLQRQFDIAELKAVNPGWLVVYEGDAARIPELRQIPGVHICLRLFSDFEEPFKLAERGERLARQYLQPGDCVTWGRLGDISEQVLPGHAFHKSPERLVANAMLGSKQIDWLASLETLTDFENLRCSQFGLTAAFAKGAALRVGIDTTSQTGRISTFGYTISNVVLMGSAKHMASSHARRIVAAMKCKILTERSIFQFKGKSMGTPSFSSVTKVAIRIDLVASPNPARTKFGAAFRNRTILINERPKAFFSSVAAEIGSATRLATKLRATLLDLRRDDRKLFAAIATSTINRHRNLTFRCTGRTVTSSFAPFSCLNYTKIRGLAA